MADPPCFEPPADSWPFCDPVSSWKETEGCLAGESLPSFEGDIGVILSGAGLLVGDFIGDRPLDPMGVAGGLAGDLILPDPLGVLRLASGLRFLWLAWRFFKSDSAGKNPWF